MRRVAGRAFGLLFQNFWWKLLALAIAVMIWAIVASEPQLTSIVPVRLEYRNLPEGLEIAAEPVSTVLLELQGPSGELSGQGAFRPSVVLDMGGVTPGERTFMIGSSSVRLPRSVRLVRAIPSQVRFSFERSARRSIPVSVRFVNEGLNGYEVAKYQVSPRLLAVEGPESRVAKIASAVTDPVDLKGVVGSSDFRVNAFVNDPYIRVPGSAQVTVSVIVRKR
jgi:hypothetical protein